MRNLPNLDFLRACAVLSVVAEHVLLAYGVQRIGYWEVRWTGVVGVFLFFVHTSLVLMWSLERKPHALDFYVRRAFRIYPLAILSVLAVWSFHAPVNGTPTSYFHYDAPHSAANIASALLLAPNLVGGYLPLSVLWSLPYEVDMYLCLPLLYFFVRENFSIWPLLFFWTFDIAICRKTFPGVAHNFFLSIPYFLPGVMAYIGFSRMRARLPSWSMPLGLLGLWAAFMLHPGWRAANLLCLATGLALPLFHQIDSRWLMRSSHAIAKYSYGLYLAHPFAIVLGLHLLPHKPLFVQLTVIAVSVTALSLVGYHLVEYPLIRLGGKIANRIEKQYRQRQLAEFRIPESEVA